MLAAHFDPASAISCTLFVWDSYHRPDLLIHLIYIAVSVTNGAEYGTVTNIAAARDLGMTDEMFAELMALIGIANQTNVLANGYQLDVDPTFLSR